MTDKSIKRSLSASPTPQPTTPKKKSQKSSVTSSPSGSKGTSGSPKSGWTNEKKRLLALRVVETGYKHTDWASLARETGMTEDQCKNQLTPGRSNARKVLSEAFGK